MIKKIFFTALAVTSLLLSNNLQSQESTWPKEITKGDYIILIYSPENMEYVDLRLKSNSAVSVKKGEEGKPTFGMMWTTTILDVDRSSKMASMASIKVDEVRFPDEVSEEQKQAFKDLIESEVPQWDFEFPLQELIDSLTVVSSYEEELNNDPPDILFTTKPSVLIITDGEPKFKEAENGYEVIINSSTFIAKESKSNTYYLKGGPFWYQADAAKGPWMAVDKVPESLSALIKETELDVDEADQTATPPFIVMAEKPSELIVSEGDLSFAPLAGTSLLYVDNSESDLFMNIVDQHYYLLISGRWFHSSSIDGTWEYIASEKLPEDFKSIPADGAKGDVLVSVAGTDQARDALYDAQIPQTAAVKKDTKAEEVKYNGEPEFQKIKGLDLEYAVNTESSVLKDGNTYFLCDNAIWFQSNSPNGPWVVSEERPEEVDKIPADNPQYNTKYVYIYETSPTVVYVGYTPGYYGSYVYGGTVVYGTGFYYNPWYAGYYYHRPYSYGFSVRYNSVTGWSFGFSFGSPYGWYGHGYWGVHYHWGPPYYRPPYYRAGYRPVPAHPIYRGHRDGVNRYQRPSNPPQRPTNPSTRPSRPSTQPVNPGRPSTRPGQPSTRPSRPSTQPATRPANPPAYQRPSNPSTRPANPPAYQRPSQPSQRPSTQPATRPPYGGGGNYGGSRPSTRPSAPAQRPAARPASRPMARPAGGGGMRRR